MSKHCITSKKTSDTEDREFVPVYLPFQRTDGEPDNSPVEVLKAATRAGLKPVDGIIVERPWDHGQTRKEMRLLALMPRRRHADERDLEFEARMAVVVAKLDRAAHELRADEWSVEWLR